MFACTVVSEPSWPVFIACNMSRASGPRTSPTMMRSGRMRSELRTRSRIAISPSPSMFFGRASSRRTCRWFSRSSAASSIVTIRSASGIDVDSAFSSVVFPEPVPPEMRMFSSARTQRWRNSTVSVRQRPEPDHVVEVEPLLAELADRHERARERQRRHDRVDAAAVRQARVDHRRRLVDAAADLSDHLVDDPPQVRFVVEPHARLVEPALAFDPDVVEPLTMTSVTLSSASSRSSGPCPRMSSAISITSRSRSWREMLVSALSRSWMSEVTRSRSVSASMFALYSCGPSSLIAA